MRHFLSAAAMVLFGTSLTQQALAGNQVDLANAAEVQCNVVTDPDQPKLFHFSVRIIKAHNSRLFQDGGYGIAFVQYVNGKYMLEEQFVVQNFPVKGPWVNIEGKSSKGRFVFQQYAIPSNITIRYDDGLGAASRFTDVECAEVQVFE